MVNQQKNVNNAPTTTIPASEAPTQVVTPQAVQDQATRVQTPVSQAQTAQGHAFDFAKQKQNNTQTDATRAAQPVMQQANAGTGTPVPPVQGQQAMPEPNPQGDGQTTRLRDRLSNKTIGLIVGISLACGLGAGIAGTGIMNAISHNNNSSHSRFEASGDFDGSSRGNRGGMSDSQDMPQMDDSQDMGGRRGRMSQRSDSNAPDTNTDKNTDNNSSDSNKSDSSNSDSNSSSKQSASSWYEEVFEII